MSLSIDAGAIALGEIYRAIMGDKKLRAGRSNIPHRCLVSSNVERCFGRLADEVNVRLLGARTLADAVLELRTSSFRETYRGPQDSAALITALYTV